MGNLFHLPSFADLAIRLPVVFLSLTVHEFMHAYTALRCGDDTAKRMGRVTLNPLAHLDLLGTICMIFGPIGWAKPVPVNPSYLRHPVRDDILVSVAGVAANFMLAATAGLILRYLILYDYPPQSQAVWMAMNVLSLVMWLNLALCFFNILPIPPLDGHHVLRELLPYPAKERFREFSRYGPIILLGFVMLNRGSGLLLLNYPIDYFSRIFIGEHAARIFFGG